MRHLPQAKVLETEQRSRQPATGQRGGLYARSGAPAPAAPEEAAEEPAQSNCACLLKVSCTSRPSSVWMDLRQKGQSNTRWSEERTGAELGEKRTDEGGGLELSRGHSPVHLLGGKGVLPQPSISRAVWQRAET